MSPREQEELGYAIQDAKATLSTKDADLDNVTKMLKEQDAFMKRWGKAIATTPAANHIETGILWLKEQVNRALMARSKAVQRLNDLVAQMPSDAGKSARAPLMTAVGVGPGPMPR